MVSCYNFKPAESVPVMGPDQEKNIISLEEMFEEFRSECDSLSINGNVPPVIRATIRSMMDEVQGMIGNLQSYREIHYGK